MADHIKIRKAPGVWAVRAAGAVLAETSNALELTEGDYPPVIYIPRDDIAMAFFEPSDTVSTCPYKGDAQYFHLVAKSGTITDAAWSYENPNEGVEAIAGHLAFYPQKVAVEKL